MIFHWPNLKDSTRPLIIVLTLRWADEPKNPPRVLRNGVPIGLILMLYGQ